MFYPSGLFRRKALAALKGHWQPALLVALIVNLPTMLMQGFSAFTGNDVLTRLQSVMVTAARDGVLSQSVLLTFSGPAAISPAAASSFSSAGERMCAARRRIWYRGRR